MVTDTVGDPNPPTRITSKVKEDTDSSGRVIRMGEGRERGREKEGKKKEKEETSSRLKGQSEIDRKRRGSAECGVGISGWMTGWVDRWVGCRGERA